MTQKSNRKLSSLQSLTIACFALSTALLAQTPAASPQPPQEPEPSPATAAEMAASAPTESDLYCAGFFSPTPVAANLFVLTSQDHGMSYEFVDRTLVYLNKGSNE